MKSLELSQNKLKRARLIIATLLAVLSTSCAKNEPITTACPTLPAAFISHLDRTPFNGHTYGDVTQYAVILKRERDMCLNRIDKIREWQTEDLNK
ncbi:Rz1-like lysis system protein LysC [Rodentibacter trehalosifermentans]|uniref:Rz1-like lysis system protein LysC n=1 Tax=Rodentibacter trehalosifermentans TaxID=1908263 RepID=UPI003CC61ACA